MIQSESINKLLAALADVQNELPTMPKASQAYGYKYCDLDTISQTIKPILHAHGVAYMQSVGNESGLTTLTTRVFNRDGEYIEDTAVLPQISGTKNNAAQTLGMSITYMRRYALCAMLGITSDEDVDANPPQQPVQPKPQQTRQPAQAEKKPQATAKATQPKPEKKGGETTPEESARLNELCRATYANGKKVFSPQEIQLYLSYRAEKYTAQELIAFVENALRNRRADAPELAQFTEDIPWEEPAGSDQQEIVF